MGEWSAGRITALWENHHVTWTGFVGAEGEERGGEEPQFLMQLAFNSQKNPKSISQNFGQQIQSTLSAREEMHFRNTSDKVFGS